MILVTLFFRVPWRGFLWLMANDRYKGSWIRAYRSLMDWEWYRDGNTMRVWMHLLLKAEYQDREYRGVVIRRGQVLYSHKDFADELGLSIQNVRTSLSHLKLTGEVTLELTGGLWLATLVQYDFWNPADVKVTGQLTAGDAGNQQANQQGAYIEDSKKRKKVKKESVRTREELRSFLSGEAFTHRSDYVGVHKYLSLYQFIESNGGDHLLQLEKLLTYLEYTELKKFSRDKKVSLPAIIEAMINAKGSFDKSKKTSFYLTARNWIRREQKQGA